MNPDMTPSGLGFHQGILVRQAAAAEGRAARGAVRKASSRTVRLANGMVRGE